MDSCVVSDNHSWCDYKAGKGTQGSHHSLSLYTYRASHKFLFLLNSWFLMHVPGMAACYKGSIVSLSYNYVKHNMFMKGPSLKHPYLYGMVIMMG